jgi:hypothetical protein
MKRRAGARPALLTGWALLLVAACGALPTQTDSLLASAPQQVRDRTPLPACGLELFGRGGPWNLPARQCFWDAYVAGEPAEFITTRPSGAGKPLVVIFRSLGGGKAEYFADESAIWGGPVWTWTTCDMLSATSDPAVAIDWVPGPEEPCDQRRIEGAAGG